MRKPGAKAIVGYKGKILLVLRDNNPNIPSPNIWNTPGGGIEDGETPVQAIRRELKEEINLEATTIIPTGVTTYSDGSIVYRFFVSISDEQFKSIKLISEGQRLDWFTVDEAIDLEKSNSISNYLTAYLKVFADDIKDFLKGERKFVLGNEILKL